VVAALVANGTYKDPYVGMNLRAIPGMDSYPIGANFVHTDMKPTSPFAVSWWYRTEFRLPAEHASDHIALHFGGINYRANIWLNGKQLSSRTNVAGAYRSYEFDVTDGIKFNESNALAVEVFAQGAADLGMNWVDWNPTPPDKDMGLWRPVYVTTSGDVQLRFPHVVTRVNRSEGQRAEGSSADVSVSVEVRNLSSQAAMGTLSAAIEGARRTTVVALAPHETRLVHLPAIHFVNPRLWWPAEMGAQNLYDLTVAFTKGSVVTDRDRVRFGMREITSELTPQGGRLFRVNGRRILVRGGGWAPDMLLRATPQRQEAELRYVRDMHLNTVRLEGKHEDESFYDIADKLGVLVMAGWSCCDQWELWSKWTKDDTLIAAQSQRDEIRRIRNRASVLVWLNGSDNPPPAKVESTYVGILKELEWQNPVLSSASAKRAATGPSGVKMTGPYDWVPPVYWLLADTLGGARGFNTETSPGPAIPPIESLKQMLPADHLWPIDSVWGFHGGGGQFTKFTKYLDAMNARYGAPTSAEDFATKSQIATYEAERAMFEAYARNKYVSTGVIQWMLNNGWPSLIWHLYDYYLRPGGGYFGAKKANEPLHVMFSPDDRSIAVVNHTTSAVRRLRVHVSAFGLDMAPLYTKDTTISAPADSSIRLFRLPDFPNAPATYITDLRMTDSAGRSVSINTYWLSARSDVPDLANSQWYGAPTKTFADFTALASLPPATVNATVLGAVHADSGDVSRVRVENTGKTLAFHVRVKLVAGRGGDEMLPVRWEDNYITLLPGERRDLAVAYPRTSAQVVAEVSGINIR
ncbi:MAG TPA: beta galactosidase jelly roll domain-containing protein, partial [Gemmatimonadaceae bacterium]|nr:beta galactosidase jelly roll domain-containing protein [Gemmatimonadaceae bacterium]